MRTWKLAAATAVAAAGLSMTAPLPAAAMTFTCSAGPR
jgi:hypothetical protein